MCYNAQYSARKSLEYAYHQGWISDVEFLIGMEKVEKMATAGDTFWASGFANPEMLILTASGMKPYSWGLLPFWFKDRLPNGEIDHSKMNVIRNGNLNSRNDTIFEKASFKNPILKNRGILFLPAFYDWREFQGKKYPYYIQPREDGQMFSIGCICESWVDKQTGEVSDTFSMVTTEANQLMSQIHNTKLRMPLILPREDVPTWIAPNLSKEDIKTLLKPYRSEQMKAHTITNEVNNARNLRDFEGVSTEVKYAELPELVL